MIHREQPSVGQIIAERKRLFAGVLLFFVAFVMFVSSRIAPVYEARTVVLVETEGAEQKISFVTAQNPFRPKSDVNSEYQVLRSRNLAQEVAGRLRGKGALDEAIPGPSVDTDVVSGWLLRQTRVRPLKGSDVVEIRAQAGAPEASAEIANTYAEVYVELARDRARAEVRRVREFLADQVQVVRERLGSTETNLRDFQERTGVASLEDETRALVEQMATFESSYNHARADLLSHQERLKLLRDQLATAQDNLASRIPVVTGPVINEMRAELADRMAYREKFLAQGYDVHHAKIQELERQVAEIQSRLGDAIEEITGNDDVPADPLLRVQNLVEQIMAEEVTFYSLEARVDALRKVVDEYSARLATLPKKSYEMGQLAHNAEVDEKILAMLLQRYEEARIEEAGLMGTAQIIDHAVVPIRPIRPDYRLNLALAILLATVFATFSCVVAHRLRKRVRSASEVSYLTGLPILARVPQLSVRDLREGSVRLRSGPIQRFRLRRRCRQVAASGSLIFSMTPWSPLVEAYRGLRVFLQQKTDGVPKTILVTSPGLGDGKTTTACNLALVLASGGDRVLLIDADMRRPRIATRFRAPQRYGLPDLLTGRCSLDQAIVRTPQANLNLLVTLKGLDSPHDLLTSPEMPRLMDDLRNRYDHVVIDSPPIVPVVDSAVLSLLVDATVLVVRSGYTEREILPHAAQVLRSLGVQVEGIVFNADRNPVGGSRYYHYYRHLEEGEQRPRLRALPGGREAQRVEERVA